MSNLQGRQKKTNKQSKYFFSPSFLFATQTVFTCCAFNFRRPSCPFEEDKLIPRLKCWAEFADFLTNAQLCGHIQDKLGFDQQLKRVI